MTFSFVKTGTSQPTDPGLCMPTPQPLGTVVDQPFPSMKVLLVDDDEALCDMLVTYLAAHDIKTTVVRRGDEALTVFQLDDFAAVILDVMLPGLDGFTVLERLQHISNCPVLMLTARGEESDRIRGLDQGATDYLAKPFSARELLARLRAAHRLHLAKPLQRSTKAADGVQPLSINAREGVALLGNARIELTYVETRVLEMLLAANGTAVRRDVLYRQALGREQLPFDRSLDTHISNLRRKLVDHQSATQRVKIRTLRGIGYLLYQ
ncbi:MAG: response regulator transcription factor [Pseudomonadota bacterium]